ncbi:MAG: HAMP domain-containing histidine kinase [Candidatus Aminicenantes bacterium]|nr:HAMP domain-containing histidine kinase [Candidatus Aminicenantes bacterium]
MIEKFHPFLHNFPHDASKELQIFSILAQGFFQPFSLMENLLVILTALTAGPGLGFNRAMLLLASGDELKGEFWLGPASPEEAADIWEVLSTPGVGYTEIIEHNRALLASETNPLVQNVKKISFPLHSKDAVIPALAASSREIILVREAAKEPLVDRHFLGVIGTDEFLCIPLLSQEEIFGEIILDNAITRRPIESRDIELASICGLAAGNYIYVTKLQRRAVEMRRQAAFGEMAMFVTHQLRTPLVTMGGFIDQLLDPKISERKRKRNLKIIRKEIGRLERIMLRLTRFFRIDIKEKVPVNIREAFKLVTDVVKPLIAERTVVLKTAIEDGLVSILCDPIHLGEALRNVVENALEALKDGGHVLLRAYRENKDWAVIAVEDDGQGIPESVKGKIFETFVSTKEKGIGLGLAYVKRFMEACGGKIVVERHEGQGTTFKLYFRTGGGG